MTQNNAMLMAIIEEQESAQLEERQPDSNNAIELFRQRESGPKRLSELKAVELFDMVLAKWCRVSGSTVSRINGENITN
jgi:hypothetical protein